MFKDRISRLIGCVLVLSVFPASHAIGSTPHGHAKHVSFGEASGAGKDQGFKTVILTCTVLDAGTGDTLAVRAGITDCNSTPCYPAYFPSFYHGVETGYFYAGGAFFVWVPTGITTVRFTHGPEYETLIDTVEVLSDTSLVFQLNRVADMAGIGWYAGDCHLHINHAGGYYSLDPVDAHIMGKAEGLTVVNCLDNDFFFTGGPDPCSTENCIVYMSEERRTVSYGDLPLLGISSLLAPFSTGWWPMAMDIADSAHTQPGILVTAAHPVTSDDFWHVEGWPGVGLARELPVDVIQGRIDAFEVMSYSNVHNGGVELEFWYRLLNCGFQLPACAGTDACMNGYYSYPLGKFRTYVNIREGGFSFENWLDGIAGGRTFVSNGPLVTLFKVLQFTAGDTLYLCSGSWDLPVYLSVECAYPLERAEIVVNGNVRKSILFEGERCEMDTSFFMTVDESCWVAARVYGANDHWMHFADSLFAHTSPMYCLFYGDEIVDREDAEFFIRWIEDLETLAGEKGNFPSPADSMRAFAEFADAKEYYRHLTRIEVAVDQLSPDINASNPFLEQNVPNPFSAGTLIEFGLPAYGPGGESVGMRVSPAPAELTVYDLRGRLVKRLFNGTVSPGRHRLYWDGMNHRGDPVASGVYFCRFSVNGRIYSRKMMLIR